MVLGIFKDITGNSKSKRRIESKSGVIQFTKWMLPLFFVHVFSCNPNDDDLQVKTKEERLDCESLDFPGNQFTAVDLSNCEGLIYDYSCANRCYVIDFISDTVAYLFPRINEYEFDYSVMGQDISIRNLWSGTAVCCTSTKDSVFLNALINVDSFCFYKDTLELSSADIILTLVKTEGNSPFL